MINPIITDKKITPTSTTSLSTEKKAWREPKIKQLNVQDTKGGNVPLPFENFLDFFESPPS